MKFFRDLFTDNEGDGDIVSSIAALATIVFLSLTVYTVVWQNKELNGSDFAIAMASLIGTLGGAYHLKANNYTKNKDDK